MSPRATDLDPSPTHSNGVGDDVVYVCHGPSCSERGGLALCEALRALLAASGDAALRVCETTCLDHCATGPNVLIGQGRRVQTGVLPSDAGALLDLLTGPPRAGT